MTRQIIVEEDEDRIVLLQKITEIGSRDWVHTKTRFPPLTTPRQRSWIGSVRLWLEAMCKGQWVGFAGLEDGSLDIWFERLEDASSFTSFWHPSLTG